MDKQKAKKIGGFIWKVIFLSGLILAAAFAIYLSIRLFLGYPMPYKTY